MHPHNYYQLPTTSLTLLQDKNYVTPHQCLFMILSLREVVKIKENIGENANHMRSLSSDIKKSTSERISVGRPK